MQLLQAAAILQTMRAPPTLRIPEGANITAVPSVRPGGDAEPQTGKGVGDFGRQNSVPTTGIQNADHVGDADIDLSIDDIIADTSVPNALFSLSSSLNSSAGETPQSLRKGKRPIRGRAPTKRGTASKKPRTQALKRPKIAGGEKAEAGPAVHIINIQVIPPEQSGPSHEKAVPQNVAKKDSGVNLAKEDDDVTHVFSEETHREMFSAVAKFANKCKSEMGEINRGLARKRESVETRQREADVLRGELQRLATLIEEGVAEIRADEQRHEKIKARLKAFADIFIE